MTAARQKALMELEARFSDVRKTREIEILKRDNALQGVRLAAEQFRRKVVLVAAILAVTICLALIWAFNRVRRISDHLRYASEHDSLTGLRNRRFFNNNILLPERGRRFDGCVVLVDVDHFKRINDILGHPTGDAVLAVLSERLAGTLRQEDVLVRWGGEEFLAVLGPMSDAELDSMAYRLLNAVQATPIQANGQTIPCTVSIGCASFPLRESAFDIALDR